ncbi:formin-like protein 1 [Saccostrea cucullata]|uniref:formin-like protein 1 n=1 Tax=Saccostrea cuccullata TaxID=36930 RepID=UPI002ED4943D
MATPTSPRAVERQKARLAKLEEKWNILFNQKTREPIYSMAMYIEYLQHYCDRESDFLSNTGHNNQGSPHPVSYFLQKLTLDLKMSYQWFIEDFCKKENDGLALLLTLLRNIQKTTKEMTSVPSKERAQIRKRLLTDEYDCLVCIKFCLRAQSASKILLDSTYGLESVASALMSSHTKSRVAALEIMSLILREPGGFSRNIDCFTYFRLKNCEPVRFKFLVNMLMSRSDGPLSFQVCCMRFLNSLITFAPNSNIKVFLQTELEMAGVDPKLLILMTEDSKAQEKDDLVREIMDFQNSKIDVDAVIEINRTLHEKISTLRNQIKTDKLLSTKTKPAPPPPPPPPIPLNHQPRSQYIPTEPAQTEKYLHNNPSVTVNVDVHLQSDPGQNSALQTLSSCLQELKAMKNNEKVQHENVECIESKDEKVPFPTKAKMPYLNWTVLGDVENTMFKSLNYERVLEQIELFELEESFKIGQEQKQEYPKPLKGGISKIHFMESSRAKNLSILQKRIGRSPIEIKGFIEEYDTDALLADNAELLLKFIPTENEMRTIMELEFQLEDLDEAEQMLVQLMAIGRLEERLRLMIFMDSFPRVAETLLSPIADLKSISTRLIRCTKLKKIFEIILAVGNFINGNRKQAIGFRVASLPLLEQIRSGDRSLTLLEYIAEIVVRHYHDSHDWYNDLDIHQNNTASFQSLVASVKDMNDGLTILQQEIAETSCQRLILFQRDISPICSKIQREFKEMETVFCSVCTMFGENPAELDSQEFLNVIHNFAESYKKADKKLSRQRWRKGINLSKTNHIKPPIPNVNMTESQYPESPTSPELVYQNSTHPIEKERNALEENETEQREKVFTFENCDIADKEIVTLSDQTIEDWVVNSPHPSACTDVLREESVARIKNLDPPKEEDDSIFDYDTASEDSAFVGSEGQYLRSSTSRTFALTGQILQNDKYQSLLRKPSPPPEPIPDYSVCGTLRLEDDVERVLKDFDGKLNEYCTIPNVAVHMGYMNMRSEIYI